MTYKLSKMFKNILPMKTLTYYTGQATISPKMVVIRQFSLYLSIVNHVENVNLVYI